MVQRQQPLWVRAAGVVGGRSGGAPRRLPRLSGRARARGGGGRGAGVARPRRRPEMLASPATRTEPWLPPTEDRWGFRRGDEVAPGRRVLRRLGDGGAHEAFLVETGASGLAVAKLPRPGLAGDVLPSSLVVGLGHAIGRRPSSSRPR